MTRPRDWTPGAVLVALAALLTAAGALWALWVLSPVLFALTATWASTVAASVWTATRNLRAELAAARDRLTAFNGSETRDDLAEVGPVSPPADTRAIDLYDWAGQAEYGIFDERGQVKPPRTLHLPEGQTVGERVKAISDHYLDAHRLDHLAQPMTPAETDRLIANLRSLPGAELAPPRSNMFVGRPILNVGHGGTWHLGQPCAHCDAPATSWVSERPDLEISDVTFLCDDCYAERMAEEADRG